MTEVITVGIVNRLTIDRLSEYGLYLTDKRGKSVLLPNLYVTSQMAQGETIEVFVYTDSEDRIVATTEMPLAMRGEFALMQVTDIAPFGAFVDWGLPKELLVPKKMQKNPLQIGRSYIIHVAYDTQTDRLVGDTHIGRYLQKAEKRLKRGTAMPLLIVARTPMGYKVIADNRYEGMLYHNEIFEPLEVGARKEGYLKKVRDDGKLDLSLQPTGKAKEASDTRKILDILQESGGTLPFTYKSDADAIAARFEMSKKRFKKALTTLIENGSIAQHDDRITLQSRP